MVIFILFETLFKSHMETLEKTVWGREKDAARLFPSSSQRETLLTSAHVEGHEIIK